MVSITVTAQNLVLNGTFTTQPASQWTFCPPGTGTENTYNETTYGGTVNNNRVAEIDAQATLRQGNISVTAGKKYYLSYLYTRRLGTYTAPSPNSINVKVYSSSNNYIDRTDVSTNTTWQWYCALDSFVATANETITIDFINTTGSSTTGTVVDNITIADSENPTVINATGCLGGDVTLNNTNVSGDNDIYSNYIWSGPNGFTATTPSVTLTNLQPSMEGTYTCRMNLNNPCFTVYALYNLSITINEYERSASICAGGTYNFYGTILNSPGDYTAIVPSTTDGCDSSITLHLTIDALPDVSLICNKATLCDGDSTLLLVATPEGSTAYQWYNNGIAIANETSPQLIVSEKGDYYFVATNSKGCIETSTTISITNSPQPVVHITKLSNDEICLTDTAWFHANYETGYIYTWYPLQYISYNNNNEASVILKEDKQLIYVNVMDENGCRGYDSTFAYAHPCCDVLIPSAFTPNSDGLNDVFMPKLNRGQIYNSFQIFDRWGNVVYEGKLSSGNAIRGWNGKYDNGEDAPLGTYMYVLRYTCTDKEIYTKKGDITLFR